MFQIFSSDSQALKQYNFASKAKNLCLNQPKFHRWHELRIIVCFGYHLDRLHIYMNLRRKKSIQENF